MGRALLGLLDVVELERLIESSGLWLLRKETGRALLRFSSTVVCVSDRSSLSVYGSLVVWIGSVLEAWMRQIRQAL